MFMDFTQLQLDDEDETIDPAVAAAAEAAKKDKEGKCWRPQSHFHVL